ncbi:alpha/beta hydrolase [Actinoplanes sp. RD1]|uniref:alpha/beta hydrolase n=1 Tax=Actinoplanes sp. RD1 TaxID=3064538 RepID=UPI002741A906|nr:hypothetical protein [Actinoplanes sp. RD1]
MSLPAEVVEAAGAPVVSIVWLHGIGQGPGDLMPVARRLRLPEQGVRGVFPRAPGQVGPMLGGAVASAWFWQRIHRLHESDLTSVLAAEDALRDLIGKEAAQLGGADRVVLAGFSQGAAMALVTALRYPARLRGLVLYAPYLVHTDWLAGSRSPAGAGLPVWIGHGARDWIVPEARGRRVRDVLTRWGHEVTWQRYSGGHEPFAGVRESLPRFLARLR